MVRSRIANFSSIIKIATMFIKTTFKDTKKLKIRNYVLKCNPCEKMLISAELKGYFNSCDLYIFWNFFR